ncbi:MAG: DUF3008 family protein [Verrucomicrobia bacterium]|nr:DUF3008 family protein [Verrucomicrobiota bacterium]
MPATSKKRRMAAGAALAAKRGKRLARDNDPMIESIITAEFFHTGL